MITQMGEGDFWHICWGGAAALYTHKKDFLPPKTRFLYLDVCLSMTISLSKNHQFSITTHVFTASLTFILH
eukprot:UN14650